MLFWRMDLKRLLCKLVLFVSVLSAVWTAFSIGPASGAEKSYAVPYPAPVPFQKILVLFSADTTKEDRDEFLAGLEEVRLRHRKEYYETFRKWRESAPAEPETAEPEEPEKPEEEDPFARKDHPMMPAHDLERLFHHNPFFLRSVDVQTIRTDEENAIYAPLSLAVIWKSRLRDMESVVRMHDWTWGYQAVIVVASDTISADLTRMIRKGFLETRANDMVVLFAGVSTFDESLRAPNGTDPANAPHAFAIRYPGDPWPNTDLALTSFPKTRKIVLLAPRRWWSADKMEKYREKVGPACSVKTIFLPEVPGRDVTEADIRELKEQFAATVNAEIEPGKTVIVSLSSVETGEDPVSWLPEKFRECPVFADTKPARPSSVGGFCRAMDQLGIQAADLLERLSEDSLQRNKLPAIIPENEELWLNSHAVRKYGLKTASFPENALLMSTSSARAPVRLGYTWTRKRVAALLLVYTFVIVCFFAYLLRALRKAKYKRQMSVSAYGALPVCIIVMDRDGRLLEYHRPYGEVESVGKFPWNNINDVPWLQGLGILETVHEVFDSGKKSVREIVVRGEPRIVVFSRTESDVFGRPAVIAVSSDKPAKNA